MTKNTENIGQEIRTFHLQVEYFKYPSNLIVKGSKKVFPMLVTLVFSNE
jgi:hypothetical protein